MGQPSAPDPRLPAAVCHYHVARDIGRAIDLEHCQRIVGAQGERPRMREAFPRAVPMRRFGEPEDLAGAVAFLASADAEYITGQTLSVSGGLTMA